MRQVKDDRLELPVPASWDASMFGTILSSGPLQQAAPRPSLEPEGSGSAWRKILSSTGKADELIRSERASAVESQGSRAGVSPQTKGCTQ